MAAREDCSCGRGPRVLQGRCYGVRSYLHLFYEDCAGSSPDGDGARSSPHRAWAPLICKVSFSAGSLLLLLGLTALAAGSLAPPKLEGIGDEELGLLDAQAVSYNQALGTCLLLGAGLCVAAGLLAALGLLSWVLAPQLPREEEQQISPIPWSSSSPWPPAALPLEMPLSLCQAQGVQPRGAMPGTGPSPAAHQRPAGAAGAARW